MHFVRRGVTTRRSAAGNCCCRLQTNSSLRRQWEDRRLDACEVDFRPGNEAVHRQFVTFFYSFSMTSRYVPIRILLRGTSECTPRISGSMGDRRLLPGGDAVLDCLLHLLEGAHLDLPHPLARDAEFLGQLLERDRLLGQPPRLEDAPLALIEDGESAVSASRRFSASSLGDQRSPGSCSRRPASPAIRRNRRPRGSAR